MTVDRLLDLVSHSRLTARRCGQAMTSDELRASFAADDAAFAAVVHAAYELAGRPLADMKDAS